MVLVRDVPMLAPMINGIAIGMGSPPATIPTMMDVTVLELWISAVAATPIIRPTKGLVANANSSLALSPTAALKPSPIAPTAASSR